MRWPLPSGESEIKMNLEAAGAGEMHSFISPGQRPRGQANGAGLPQQAAAPPPPPLIPLFLPPLPLPPISYLPLLLLPTHSLSRPAN